MDVDMDIIDIDIERITFSITYHTPKWNVIVNIYNIFFFSLFIDKSY